MNRTSRIYRPLVHYLASGLIATSGFLPTLMLIPVSPVMAQSAKLPSTVAERVKQDITRTFRIPLRNLKVVNFSQQSWPDGCLGLDKPDESCTQAIVEGWRVEVTDGAQQYIYRTDNTGKTLRSETSPQSILPLAVAQKLQQFAAKELGMPIAQLKITAIKSRVFDGCLGIFTPNQGCTRIGIQGWQAVVKNGRTSWLYHLNQTATRIVQNTTASNALAPVEISFAEGDAALKKEIIFQSSSTGDITGRTITTTLTVDGKVTQLTVAPNIRSRPVVLRTLTPQQVAKFKALLTQQRFPNLNGLNYLTSASVADVPTITLQDFGTRVNYTSIEKDKVPKSLQVVIDAWNRILIPKN